MPLGEVFFFLIFNLSVIAGLYLWQKRGIESLLKQVKKEIQELEDLVTAIIEELEESTAGGAGTASTAATITDTAVSDPDRPSETLAMESSTPVEVDTPQTDSRQKRILELGKQGVPVEEIARQLGTGRGEVQLVLGIHRQN